MAPSRRPSTASRARNVWLIVGLREGKNREIKRVLAHLGLATNRLIRISYGPFQLGDLPRARSREIRGRVLRDQLGAKLAEAAGADFEAPLRQPPPPKRRRGRRAAASRVKPRRGSRAVRIVGGEFRGRPLADARARATSARPPTACARRSSTSSPTAYGDPVSGARVLDLFAGTGALGLEALSRGAAYALFVEEGVEARGLIRRNVEALGLTGRTRIFRRDATALGPAGTVAPFGLVFADPPYGAGPRRAGASPRPAPAAGSRPDALCVLEEDRDGRKSGAIAGFDLA